MQHTLAAVLVCHWKLTVVDRAVLPSATALVASVRYSRNCEYNGPCLSRQRSTKW
jgi:hypothetical protein